MTLPDFIRWCDLRGVLGVREGFLIEDLERLALKHLIPTFDAELRPVALPNWPEEQHDAAYDWPNLSPEEHYDAAYDGPGTPEERYEAAYCWPDLSTEEGRREFGRFQFDTLRAIRALAVEGEPMSELARAYLEAERQKIQAAKEEAEQAKAEAEAAAAMEALFEQVRAAGKKVIQGRRGDGQSKGRGHEPDAYAALNEVYHVPYKAIARAFFEGAGVSNPSDAELEKEEANLRAVVSKERRKRKRPSAKGD
ncbi:hypothetical protein [Desulfovibrio aminophilus]|uniref:hypothetical protein n=1 Tax=Desulfovibrio aminophilus TaxID=81425 RepID=UPI0003F7C070|nr:hypothetical protein [Desulfovibrio aminophilus]